MDGGLVETAAQRGEPDDRRIYGVTLGRVVANCDEKRAGRVQVRLPWLPGYEPWARVATPMAGKNQGLYFMPQVDDEVLVGCHDGDITDAYVLGCVWNARDVSPSQEAHSDPVNKRLIRTPLGHEIIFDETDRSITITSADKQRITLGPKRVEITLDEKKTTAITLEDGKVTIKASSSITLDAPTINIKGTEVEVKGSSSAKVNGGARCSIDAAQISIG